LKKIYFVIFTIALVITFTYIFFFVYTSDVCIATKEDASNSNTDFTHPKDNNTQDIEDEKEVDTKTSENSSEHTDDLSEPIEDTTSEDTTEEDQTSDTVEESIPQQPELDNTLTNDIPITENIPEADQEQATEPTEEIIPQQPKLIDTLNKQNMWFNKTVYLTFDDGPSKLTGKILDLLNKENIKATFFVVGIKTDEQKNMLKRIHSEGHAIGNHTYSHDYDYIYKEVNNFFKDLYKNEKMIYDAIRKIPKIIRFPGGSNNTTSNTNSGKRIINDIIDRLTDEGYVYFDWNASSGDASPQPATVDEIINNVLTWVSKNNNAVVLFHDTASKKNTLEALPIIIEKLKFLGCKFDILTTTSPHVAFIKTKSNSSESSNEPSKYSNKPLYVIKKLYMLESANFKTNPDDVKKELLKLELDVH